MQCDFKKRSTNEQCPNIAEWEASDAVLIRGRFCFKHRTVAGGTELRRIAGEPKRAGRAVLMSDLFRYDNQRHNIPIGQVVEVTYNGDESPWGIEWSNGRSIYTGPRYDMERHEHIQPPAEFKEVCLGIRGTVKAIVVGFTRDCDGTPLYILSDKPIGYTPGGGFRESHEYGSWVNYFEHGFSERSLKVCTGEFIPLKYRDIWHYKRCLLGEDRDLYGHIEE